MTPQPDEFEAWWIKFTQAPAFLALSEAEIEALYQHTHAAFAAGQRQQKERDAELLHKYGCHIQSGCMKEVYGYQCGCGLDIALRGSHA